MGLWAIQVFRKRSASSSELLSPVFGIVWFHKHLTPISSLMSLLSVWCYVCVSSFHKDIELDLSPYFTMASSLTLSSYVKPFPGWHHILRCRVDVNLVRGRKGKSSSSTCLSSAMAELLCRAASMKNLTPNTEGEALCVRLRHRLPSRQRSTPPTILKAC